MTSSPSSGAAKAAPPPAELMVVISAAVATVLGRRARVLGYRDASSLQHDIQAFQWAFEGRRQIYQSHKIR